MNAPEKIDVVTQHLSQEAGDARGNEDVRELLKYYLEMDGITSIAIIALNKNTVIPGLAASNKEFDRLLVEFPEVMLRFIKRMNDAQEKARLNQ